MPQDHSASESAVQRRSQKPHPVMCYSGTSILISIPRLSLNDELTQLYNREGFICTGEELLGRANGYQRWACLLSLQVNHLDVFDQALGSEIANRFLKSTGACLREVFKRHAVIGRIAPTRFAVLTLANSPAHCRTSLQQFVEAIDRENLRRHAVDLSLAGGYSQFDARSPVSICDLLIAADERFRELYSAPCASTG